NRACSAAGARDNVVPTASVRTMEENVFGPKVPSSDTFKALISASPPTDWNVNVAVSCEPDTTCGAAVCCRTITNDDALVAVADAMSCDPSQLLEANVASIAAFGFAIASQFASNSI